MGSSSISPMDDDPISAAYNTNDSIPIILINISDDSRASQALNIGTDTYTSINFTINSTPRYLKSANITLESSYSILSGVSATLQAINDSTPIDICNLSISTTDNTQRCSVTSTLRPGEQTHNLTLRLKSTASLTGTQHIDLTLLNAMVVDQITYVNNNQPLQAQTITTTGKGWTNESNLTLNVYYNSISIGDQFPINISTDETNFSLDFALNDTLNPGNYTIIATQTNNNSKTDNSTFTVNDRIILELSSDIISPNHTPGIYTLNITDLGAGLSVIDTFTVTPPAALNFTIQQANNASVNVSVRVLLNGTLVALEDANASVTLDYGEKYDLELEVNNSPIHDLVIYNATLSSTTPFTIGIDDPAENISIAEAFGGINEIYAINPPLFNFTQINVTVTAQEGSRVLMKCEGYNFTTQNCYGGWKAWQRLEPGQNYTFTLNSTDPALAEVNGTFFDGFETANLINGWNVSSGWVVVSTGTPFSGTYHAEDKQTFATGDQLNNSVSTVGYQNISFSFARATVGLDTGEYLSAEAWNGSAMTVVMNVTGTNTYTIINTTLPGTFSNNPQTKIIYRCLSSAGNEFCRIDNVLVTGNSITITPPPSPSPPPPNKTVELGDDSFLTWTLNGTGGQFFVLRNGTLFDGPRAWEANSTISVRADSFFLGVWNYTLSFNDTTGVNGTQSSTFLTVIDNVKPSCTEVQNPDSSGSIITKDITIDGSFTDWDAILSNPTQSIGDPTLLQGDSDVPGTADRDMVRFAYTNNNQTLTI